MIVQYALDSRDHRAVMVAGALARDRPRQRLSDAHAVLAYSREVATAPLGPNGTPMTVIPFEVATP